MGTYKKKADATYFFQKKRSYHKHCFALNIFCKMQHLFDFCFPNLAN